MTVRDFAQETNYGTLLDVTPTAISTAVAASHSELYHRILLENLGYFNARAWVWRRAASGAPTLYAVDLRGDGDSYLVHGDADADALLTAYPLPTKQKIAVALDAASHIPVKASGILYAMTDYADYGTANAAVLTTSEIVSTAGSSTYTATTCIDTALNLTASAANGDCVGRRVENGNVYGIVTSNTGGAGTSTLTMSGGWIDKRTGLVGTTPTNATAFTITATLRDTRETTLPVSQYAGHKIECNGKTLRIANNAAGIATYGTVFAGIAGGWSGGTNPGNGNAWQVHNLVRCELDDLYETIT